MDVSEHIEHINRLLQENLELKIKNEQLLSLLNKHNLHLHTISYTNDLLPTSIKHDQFTDDYIKIENIDSDDSLSTLLETQSLVSTITDPSPKQPVVNFKKQLILHFNLCVTDGKCSCFTKKRNPKCHLFTLQKIANFQQHVTKNSKCDTHKEFYETYMMK